MSQAPDDLSPLYQSRSSKKRAMLGLTALGKKLVSLPKATLKKLPLDDRLYEAIVEAQALKSKEALRRQMHFVGKCVRHADAEAIQRALVKVQEGEEVGVATVGSRWFHRLIMGDHTTLQQLLEEHDQLDRQRLRQLVRQTKKDLQQGTTSKANRSLLRYLEEALPEPLDEEEA